MMERVVLGGLATVVVAACSSLGASEDAQDEALEGQAKFTADAGAGGGFCDLVQQTIDAGGMKYPLAYPVDVLERYKDEHC